MTTVIFPLSALIILILSSGYRSLSAFVPCGVIFDLPIAYVFKARTKRFHVSFALSTLILDRVRSTAEITSSYFKHPPDELKSHPFSNNLSSVWSDSFSDIF